MSRRVRVAKLLGVAGLVLAAALRMRHLDWSLPHTYEEATPLRIAWEMWGWDRGRIVDLNPGFFNYPSLTFYLHFIAQGALYLLIQLTGGLDGLADWRAMRLVDPTPLFLTGRFINVSFGVATTWIVYRTARAVGGTVSGLVALALIAVNPFHIARSQMIEVDVPLTFFVALALHYLIRTAAVSRMRDSILAGLAVGLAISTKYTGCFLLVPMVVAHVLGMRIRPLHGAAKSGLARLGLGIATVVVVFCVTSPYVILDLGESSKDLQLERQHMAVGHFGADERPTWLFYAQELAADVLNPPVLLAALIGSLWLITRARSGPALVLVSFVLAYLIVISAWEMKAERYLLPVLPVLLAFAGVGAGFVVEQLTASRVPRGARRVGLALILGLLIVPQILRYARHVNAYQSDARTDVAEWLESNAPSGAYIVTEHYGPELISPSQLVTFEPDFRREVETRLGPARLFAVQTVPMFQTHPERSEPYYSLELYPNADYVIKSSGVAARYERDAARFRGQLTFYRSLDESLERVGDFPSRRPGGVHLTVYRRRPLDMPFALRKTVEIPPPQAVMRTGTGDTAARFYFELGANCEHFGHSAEASVSYRSALAVGMDDEDLFYQCVFGDTRCLLQLGRTEEAVSSLRSIVSTIPDGPTRAALSSMAEQLSEALRRRQVKR